MDIQEIIKKGPDFVLELLNSSKENSANGSSINWVALSDCCSSKARDSFESGDFSGGKSWSLSAIKVYEYLAANSSSDSLIIGYEISAVRVRVNAINVLGENATDELCNIDFVEKWFNEKLIYSRDIIVEKANDWMSLPKEEILFLRNVKNMLNALELVKDSSCFSDESGMEAWFEIKGKLP